MTTNPISETRIIPTQTVTILPALSFTLLRNRFANFDLTPTRELASEQDYVYPDIPSTRSLRTASATGS
jgi:hypothetical protein